MTIDTRWTTICADANKKGNGIYYYIRLTPEDCDLEKAGAPWGLSVSGQTFENSEDTKELSEKIDRYMDLLFAPIDVATEKELKSYTNAKISEITRTLIALKFRTNERDYKVYIEPQNEEMAKIFPDGLLLNFEEFKTQAQAEKARRFAEKFFHHVIKDYIDVKKEEIENNQAATPSP